MILIVSFNSKPGYYVMRKEADGKRIMLPFWPVNHEYDAEDLQY